MHFLKRVQVILPMPAVMMRSVGWGGAVGGELSPREEVAQQGSRMPAVGEITAEEARYMVATSK